MFSRGIPLKLVSLVIALILSYAVQSGRNSSVVSLFIPIELKNVPEDRAIVSPRKKGVQVTLKGPSFVIGPVASSPPAMRVKLPDTQDDRVTVSFTAADIALPSSVEVMSIEPSQMEFVFEALERQDVRVEVPRIGQLAKGLILEGVEITPKVIQVRGSRSELRQLKVLQADPIDLGEISASKEYTLDLRIAGNTLTPAVKSVVVKVLVNQQPTTKISSARPIELRLSNGIGGFEVRPSRVAVTVSGSPDVISRLEDSSLIPYVRVVGMPSDTEEARKVDVETPPGIHVVSVEPESVMLRKMGSAGSKPSATRGK